MNRINQLFNSNKKDLLSIYFCAGDPTLDGTADVTQWQTVLSFKMPQLKHYAMECP